MKGAYPAMESDDHLFRLEPAPLPRDSEKVPVSTRRDVQWGRPIFRAPALPTPDQIASELPSTVNFRPRLQQR
jgi:hypothetical protein